MFITLTLYLCFTVYNLFYMHFNFKNADEQTMNPRKTSKSILINVTALNLYRNVIKLNKLFDLISMNVRLMNTCVQMN